jgi:hypothetical protein
MKFLCVTCDERMSFADRDVPGDGTLAAVFECPGCGRAVAMLTNPMETQLVSSLGVEIGGSEVPEQPMEATRSMVGDAPGEAFEDAADEAPGSGPAAGEPGRRPAGPEGGADGADGGRETTVEWSPEAEDRLDRVPSFVRGMVHRIYTDWARERGIGTITPEVMDRARSDLGLEGM